MLSSVASPQGTVWHAAAFDGWWCGWFLPGIFMFAVPWICIKRTATGPDEYVTVGFFGFFGLYPMCFPVCYLCPDKHTRSQPGSNVFTKTGGCVGNGEGTDMTESATVYCVLVLRASLCAFTDNRYSHRGTHAWACAACAESAVARPQASSSL